MKTIFRITKIPPSTNNLYINLKKGRMKSQQYETWIQEAGIDYLRQRPKPVSGPVHITMEFREPNRKRDIDNAQKAPLDFLVSTGLIEADDNTIVRSLTSRWSDEVEGCRITIESIFHRVPEASKTDGQGRGAHQNNQA